MPNRQAQIRKMQLRLKDEEDRASPRNKDARRERRRRGYLASATPADVKRALVHLAAWRKEFAQR